jgi:hypothetical protein
VLVHDAGFASGVMSRLTARRTLLGPPLELTLARLRSHLRIQRISHHHHSALHLALRLATSLFGGSREAIRPGSAAPLALNLAHMAFPLADRQPTAATAATLALRPLPLVLARNAQGGAEDTPGAPSRARVGPLTRDGAAPRPSLLAGTAPLRRVLRASPATVTERKPPSDAAAAPRSDTRPDGNVRDRVARAPQPALDLNGLTNQVIRAIDRRIIAQRERLGRP